VDWQTSGGLEQRITPPGVDVMTPAAAPGAPFLAVATRNSSFRRALAGPDLLGKGRAWASALRSAAAPIGAKLIDVCHAAKLSGPAHRQANRGAGGAGRWRRSFSP